MASGKYDLALQTFEQAFVHTNLVYLAAVATICADWARSIPLAQKGGPALRLQLIQKGLTNAPQNLDLQLLLAAASHATDETAPTAKKLLADSVASATNREASAWWHFALWTDARMRGDLPTARQHLQTAYQLAPEIPKIKNDMAMDLSTGSREQAEQGLLLIQSLVAQSPEDPGWRDTRGQILAKLGRNQEALADLEFAAQELSDPRETQQVLAKVYAALGRKVPVPQPHASPILSQAHTLASQHKFAEALAKLEPEMRQNPKAAYAAAIADICAAWVTKTPASQRAERLRLIQKGLGYDPQHPALMALLLQATHAADDSGMAAKKLLDQLVATAIGNAAADWHLFLGQDARARGDLSAARQELQTAYGLAPERTDIKSALARVLVAGNQDDWQQALQLIQPILDQFPENPEYRNTRGLLLARLGQNQAAAADLAYAVTKLPSPSDSRLELAKVYDALGKSQLADQQRRLATPARKP
jgi:Flp pilus assembly protein TadD